MDTATARIAALEADAKRTCAEQESASASLQEKLTDARSLLDEARSEAERARAEQAAEAAAHERDKDAWSDRLADARTLSDQCKAKAKADQRAWAAKLAEQEGVVVGLQAKLDDAQKLLDGAKAQADRVEKACAAKLAETGASRGVSRCLAVPSCAYPHPLHCPPHATPCRRPEGLVASLQAARQDNAAADAAAEAGRRAADAEAALEKCRTDLAAMKNKLEQVTASSAAAKVSLPGSAPGLPFPCLHVRCPMLPPPPASFFVQASRNNMIKELEDELKASQGDIKARDFELTALRKEASKLRAAPPPEAEAGVAADVEALKNLLRRGVRADVDAARARLAVAEMDLAALQGENEGLKLDMKELLSAQETAKAAVSKIIGDLQRELQETKAEAEKLINDARSAADGKVDGKETEKLRQQLRKAQDDLVAVVKKSEDIAASSLAARAVRFCACALARSPSSHALPMAP